MERSLWLKILWKFPFDSIFSEPKYHRDFRHCKNSCVQHVKWMIQSWEVHWTIVSFLSPVGKIMMVKCSKFIFGIIFMDEMSANVGYSWIQDGGFLLHIEDNYQVGVILRIPLW